MAVRMTRNFPPLDETPLFTRDDWARIGRLARERIIRRTIDGIDEDDRPFAPYSERYAEQKQAAGGSARVDLQLSGEMLRNIVIEPDEDSVTLRFSS